MNSEVTRPIQHGRDMHERDYSGPCGYLAEPSPTAKARPLTQA